MTNLHERAYTVVLKGAVIRDVGIEFENSLHYDHNIVVDLEFDWTDFPRENWRLSEALSGWFWL